VVLDYVHGVLDVLPLVYPLLSDDRSADLA
jgi:hypothetical protein